MIFAFYVVFSWKVRQYELSREWRANTCWQRHTKSFPFNVWMVLTPFHSTCPGRFCLRALIRCLFSHFSVQSSILCTSWRGRQILSRSFFAVSVCLKHRLKHYIRLSLFFQSEPACLQHLRQYWTHMKHANFGRCGITLTIVPACQLWPYQGPLNQCALRDGNRDSSPCTALRNNCPSGRMVIRIHSRVLRTEDWRMLWFFVSNSKMKQI